LTMQLLNAMAHSFNPSWFSCSFTTRIHGKQRTGYHVIHVRLVFVLERREDFRVQTISAPVTGVSKNRLQSIPRLYVLISAFSFRLYGRKKASRDDRVALAIGRIWCVISIGSVSRCKRIGGNPRKLSIL
jgi:hypothetical protein